MSKVDLFFEAIASWQGHGSCWFSYKSGMLCTFRAAIHCFGTILCKTFTIGWGQNLNCFLEHLSDRINPSRKDFRGSIQNTGKRARERWQYNPQPDAYGDGMYMVRNKTRLISRREAKHVEHPVASCIRFLLCRDGNEAHKKAREEFVKNNL